jgi:hypothetical protein
MHPHDLAYKPDHASSPLGNRRRVLNRCCTEGDIRFAKLSWPRRSMQMQEPGAAAPIEVADAPRLQSMLSTADLLRRPSRSPDYAAENEALFALVQELTSSPEGILQRLADTALRLCRAHSAGLSLLEEGDNKSNFHWRAIAGSGPFT